MFGKRFLSWLISLTMLSTVMITLGIIWGRLFDNPDIVIMQDIGASLESPLYIMQSDGKYLKRLTAMTYFPGSFALSPDQTRFAYIGVKPGGEDYLFVQTIGSGDVVQLTDQLDDVGLNSFGISWSPDGTRLTFGARNSTNATNDIYVINADGSNLVNLTNSPTNEYFPVWSPTEETILYQSYGGGQNALHTMNADGSDPRTLHVLGNFSNLVLALVWSPDGTKIAYHFGNNLYRINADGTNHMQIGASPTVNNLHWFTDDQLVFHSPYQYQGWSMIETNSTRTSLLDLTLPPAGIISFSPRWQPPPLIVDTPPVADAGADQQITATDGISADVTLDASKSYDSDGFIESYVWVGDSMIVHGSSITTIPLAVGVHKFGLVVRDDRGNNATDEVIITVLAPD